MAAPSLLSARRFAQPLRTRLQVAYAKAFEALAETYTTQAVAFVRRLEGRLVTEDALERFFREIPVPVGMREVVRARALITLDPVGEEVEPTEPDPWTSFRPEALIDALRRRAQFVEEVNYVVRLAVSAAEEAVIATHVRMALAVAEVLEGELPADLAVMHYVRTFDLSSLTAQMVYQRALAELADRAAAKAKAPEPVRPAVTAAPSPEPAVVGTVGAFGIRVPA